MSASRHYRAGLPADLSTRKARERLWLILRWLAALALVLLVVRLSMDDEIVAEQMRADLQRAVITVNARADKTALTECDALSRRKAHSTEQIARQCVDRGAP